MTVAVVRGNGSIGRRHAAVLRTCGVETRVWPVRPDATLLDDTSGHDAYQDADLVVVATDTRRHVADAIEALDCGAQRVLVEKPLAPTGADCAPLLEHARRDSVSVAAPLRAHEAFGTLAGHVAQLEGVLSASVRCQSWLPDWRRDRDYRDTYAARPDEGGVLRDLVHEIDYAAVLFGPAVLRGAHLGHDGPLDMAAEQAADLMWTAGRAVVQARLDYVTRPTVRHLTVRSETGSVVWDVVTATVTTIDAAGVGTARTFPDDLARDTVMARQARALPGPDDGAPGAPATLAEGVAAVEFCDRARQLADLGGAR